MRAEFFPKPPAVAGAQALVIPRRVRRRGKQHCFPLSIFGLFSALVLRVRCEETRWAKALFRRFLSPKWPCCGISVLPKDFISWFRGYQYTGLVVQRSRSHQFPPYASLGCPFTLPRVGERNERKGKPVQYPVRDFFSPSCPILNSIPALGKNVNDTSGKHNRQEKTPPRYVFDQPLGKGCQEAFRRGHLAVSETQLQDHRKYWDSRRAYSVHPYFSNNLKYAC